MQYTQKRRIMLNGIQNEFKFKYPDIYLQIERDGNLDWGEQGPNQTVSHELRKKPPLLLFGNDFRLLDEDRIRKLLIQFRSGWDSSGKFVPFGRNGAGDYFAFVFGTQNTLEYICKLNRNSDEGFVLAKNFDDFLFRELLHAAYNINEFDIDENDFDEFRANLYAMLNSHRAYINNRRVKILEEVYSRPISRFDDEEFGMIDENMFYEILDQEIKFDLLDKKFKYRKL